MDMPSVKSFTTDPTKQLDSIENAISNVVDKTSDTVQDSLTGSLSEVGDSLNEGLTSALGFSVAGFNVASLVRLRCENVPDFGARFDTSLPDLGLNISDLPCGLDEKINELLDDFENEAVDTIMGYMPWNDDDEGDDEYNPTNSPQGKPTKVSIIEGVDPMEVKVNQQTVAAFTGDTSVVIPTDNAMSTATAGGLIRQSTRFGTADNLKSIFENAPIGTDKSKMYMYLLGSMYRAIDAGNIDMINACTDIVTGSAFLSVYPNCVQRILAGYTLPVGKTTEVYETEATRLIDCLDRIDPKWDRYLSIPKYNTSGKLIGYECDVPTVKPYINAGDAAITVLALHDRTKVQVSLAANVRTMRIQSAVKLYYPYAAMV